MAMKDYSDEFKADAVALYESTPGATYKSIAADLGINRATLREWVLWDRERRGVTAAAAKPAVQPGWPWPPPLRRPPAAQRAESPRRTARAGSNSTAPSARTRPTCAKHDHATQLPTAQGHMAASAGTTRRVMPTRPVARRPFRRGLQAGRAIAEWAAGAEQRRLRANDQKRGSVAEAGGGLPEHT
ncbi:transposase [Streptomyces sp. NPDC058964]|uniref:transposase n=1 Tax=Streptomyces sp. NPDC058964 TaxID=3346681 RepID=UPI00369436BC